MKAAHLRSGTAAERFARQWLCSQGLKCIESNFRCKAGELDLILIDRDCLVIAEVRYRSSDSHGGALASVTRPKQRRIIRATLFWLKAHPALVAMPLRFDVLALDGPLHSLQVTWCKRAFDATA